MSPSNTMWTSSPKRASSCTKKALFSTGKGCASPDDRKGRDQDKGANFNTKDFPFMANAQTKGSGWVGVAFGHLSPSASKITLQRQNGEPRRHTEDLAKKSQELETKLARLTEL
ncbi:hypothetical protein HPB51_020691 [Rhipicephalus microplus]|uniref:Uncharacterized protein n=1 Tax=Rhipicephalus microplus TaxID=6941 RepID=A0A9J6EUR1_RHIMP|nr:hypothetical protein HPB51_020691 [Rhipicephalus microplus]